MAALALNLDDLHEPTPEEVDAARQASRAFARVDRSRPVRLRVEGDDATTVTLPEGIFSIMLRMLAEVGNGNPVTMVPVFVELTTTQAAELLNVSRPHLTKLLSENALPYRMVGTHRKLLAKDVLQYQAKIAAKQREALLQMAALDQETGIFDDDVPFERRTGA